MTRKIYKSDNTVNYTNTLYMSYDYDHIVKKDVPFDFVESYYLINNEYIICPKGPYHPYNLNQEKYEIPNNFEEKGIKNWDLKCYKFDSDYLLIFYLINGNKNFFYRELISSGTTGAMPSQDDELYDYKLDNQNTYQGKDKEYPMMALLQKDKKIYLKGKAIYLKAQKGQYEAGKTLELCSIKTYNQAYFNNYTNSFYYMAYDNIHNFTSGYAITSSNEINVDNFGWENISSNTISPFEFLEEVEIEEMNIVLYNRFVYYKIKEKNNDEKKYNGILDIVLNKVVFNTNETINYFIPYSNITILAITPSEAYKICIYKENGKCVEECTTGYKYDVDGNICSSSSSCENKITLIPNGICIDSCDERYYFKNETHCGLCRDVFPNENSYKIVNGTACREIDLNSMEYYNEDLKLLKCKDGFILKDNDCISEGNECYKLCEKNQCTETSDDENDQHCTGCINEYYLENGNCKKNCSERYMISGKICVPCQDNYCESFEINTCNCTNCLNGFYMNKSNLCDQCDSSCLKCEGNSDNCTECNNTYSFIFENKCINCSTNCEEKESDNCKCKECNKGFYLKDFICNKCSDNCQTCEGNSDYCTSCANNSFLNNENNKCEDCSTECESCFNERDNCTSCRDGKYLNSSHKCENCSFKCKTCNKGYIEGNDNCLSCYNDNEHIYKYLINDEDNKTCVENCTTIGREFSDDNKTCAPLKKSSQEGEETPDEKDADYFLWIFIIIIAIMLIVITICIFKKACYSNDKNNYFESIPDELDEKGLIP